MSLPYSLAVALVGATFSSFDSALHRTAVRNAATSLVTDRRRTLDEARTLRDLAAAQARWSAAAHVTQPPTATPAAPAARTSRATLAPVPRRRLATG